MLKRSTDLRPPLAGRRALPALPALVSVGHRDDVLGFPERQRRRSAGARRRRSIRPRSCCRPQRPARKLDQRPAAGAGAAQHVRRPAGLSLPRRPRRDAIVYADTGDEQIEVSKAMMDRVASAWTGQPVERRDASNRSRKSISGRSRARSQLRPLWKYSWPDGEQVYVSGATGEVVQYTTTASRSGAYVGAIPHWLYFTPLRKHGREWSQVVIWSSGIGTVSARSSASSIGVWMYSPSKRYRYAGAPTSIPYRGQKRWHTIFGLIFGLGAATWAFSGMLSMDPFPRATGRPGGGGRRGGGRRHSAGAARPSQSAGGVRAPSTRARRSRRSRPPGQGAGAHVVRRRAGLSRDARPGRHAHRAARRARRRPLRPPADHRRRDEGR